MTGFIGTKSPGDCGICYEKNLFVYDHNQLGHTYCEPCLTQWIELHPSCPSCRRVVDFISAFGVRIWPKRNSLMPSLAHRAVVAFFVVPTFLATASKISITTDGLELGSGLIALSLLIVGVALLLDIAGVEQE